jgi:hypothetical protein
VRMRVVLENEFVRVEELTEQHVIVLRRKALSPPTARIPAIYGDVFAGARPEWREWGLVIDVRAVAGNNDPEFESAMRPVRRQYVSLFARVVVLVRSIAGRMQIERTNREDGTRVGVAEDEAEAIALAQNRDDGFW